MFFPTHFKVEIIILSYQKMFSSIFTVDERHHTLNICPRHRADFGIRWRTRKTLCTVPMELAVHKCGSAKGSFRANSQQSDYTDILIPVGSRKLVSVLKNHVDYEQSLIFLRDSKTSETRERAYFARFLWIKTIFSLRKIRNYYS